MHIEQVEIYSDQTNAAVMRHPGRRFPGVLIQGDTLNALCRRAGAACTEARSHLGIKPYEELNDLRNALWSFLSHYRQCSESMKSRCPSPKSLPRQIQPEPIVWPNQARTRQEIHPTVPTERLLQFLGHHF